jgi:hypothetical protein
MTDEASENGFAVGYKKPPQHSRFRPGRSGNPRGWRKGVRNLGSDVKRTLEVPVTLSDQGRARRVSTQEAVLLRLREKALRGDARSLDHLIELARIFNSGAAEAAGGDALAAEDQAILDAYAARFAPGHQAQLPPGGAEDNGANRDG